ncbi:MAG: hypothetical protein AAB225_27720, partial [Acidobacteriota bacterium]
AAGMPELPLLTSISQYGITWTFDRAAPCGQFVNGDWYVVGEVDVIQITPAPAPGRNGSVLNLTTNNGKTGFDSRLSSGRYSSAYDVYPPVKLKPGDALISSISVEKPGVLPNMLRPSDHAANPIQTAAVLTCMSGAVPADTFRPSYCDRRRDRLYHAGDLQRGLLPRLPLDGIRMRYDSGPLSLAFMERIFERPWLDTITYGFAAPMENMPVYGREFARAAGIGSLLLCSDFTPEQKEKLLINMVQVGIDLWGIVQAGGHAGWFAHGGHNSGRKWLIAFAGLMLGDAEMAAPSKTYPSLALQEDMQTMYDKGWTGAGVVYAGHFGSKGHPDNPDWGSYEHLPPAEWPGDIGESYRRCCTSLAWVGQALAARILGAEDEWNHPAFFDYVDRWMTEDDSEAIQVIKQVRGRDYSASWSRQRQTWDPFVQDMWDTYRWTYSPQPARRGGDRRGAAGDPPRR